MFAIICVSPRTNCWKVDELKSSLHKKDLNDRLFKLFSVVPYKGIKLYENLAIRFSDPYFLMVGIWFDLLKSLQWHWQLNALQNGSEAFFLVIYQSQATVHSIKFPNSPIHTKRSNKSLHEGELFQSLQRSLNMSSAKNKAEIARRTILISSSDCLWKSLRIICLY